MLLVDRFLASVLRIYRIENKVLLNPWHPRNYEAAAFRIPERDSKVLVFFLVKVCPNDFTA